MHVFLTQLYFFFQPQSTFYRPLVYVPFAVFSSSNLCIFSLIIFFFHSTGMSIFFQSYNRMSVSSILQPYYHLANLSIKMSIPSVFYIHSFSNLGIGVSISSILLLCYLLATIALMCPFHPS